MFFDASLSLSLSIKRERERGREKEGEREGVRDREGAREIALSLYVLDQLLNQRRMLCMCCITNSWIYQTSDFSDVREK